MPRRNTTLNRVLIQRNIRGSARPSIPPRNLGGTNSTATFSDLCATRTPTQGAFSRWPYLSSSATSLVEPSADRCRSPNFTTERTRPFSLQAMRATGRCRASLPMFPFQHSCSWEATSAHQACMQFTIPRPRWPPEPARSFRATRFLRDRSLPSQHFSTSSFRRQTRQMGSITSRIQFSIIATTTSCCAWIKSSTTPTGSTQGTARIGTERTTLLRFPPWDPHFLKGPPPTSKYPLRVRLDRILSTRRFITSFLGSIGALPY